MIRLKLFLKERVLMNGDLKNLLKLPKKSKLLLVFENDFGEWEKVVNLKGEVVVIVPSEKASLVKDLVRKFDACVVFGGRQFSKAFERLKSRLLFVNCKPREFKRLVETGFSQVDAQAKELARTLKLGKVKILSQATNLVIEPGKIVKDELLPSERSYGVVPFGEVIVSVKSAKGIVCPDFGFSSKKEIILRNGVTVNLKKKRKLKRISIGVNPLVGFSEENNMRKSRGIVTLEFDDGSLSFLIRPEVFVGENKVMSSGAVLV